MDIAQIALWRASIALEVVLLARVAISFRRLKWFAVALTAMTVQDLCLLPLRPGSKEYFWTWVACAILALSTKTAAAVEAYRNVLTAYHGIGSLATWILWLGTGVALIVTAMASGPDARAMQNGDFLLSAAVSGVRVWSTGLAIFFVSAALFLFWFNVPRRANDKRHLIILTSLFALHGSIYFLRNAMPQYSAIISASSQAGVCICLLAWLFTLSARGEVVPRSTGPMISAALFEEWNREALAILRSGKRG